MRRRLQVAAGGQFEELADVDDEVSGQGFDVDPGTVDLHLEAGASGFRIEQRENSHVLVTAHTLSGDRSVVARVTHDLQQRIGVRERTLEEIGWCGKGFGPCAEESTADRAGLFDPLQRERPQLRHPAGPQVRTVQHLPRSMGVELCHRSPFGADVELLAPVHISLGSFTPDAGVAAEMRRVGVLDLQLHGVGQGEERACRRDQPVGEGRVDAVAGQVEEADLVRDPAQPVEQGGPGGGIAVEACEVDDGQGGRGRHRGESFRATSSAGCPGNGQRGTGGRRRCRYRETRVRPVGRLSATTTRRGVRAHDACDHDLRVTGADHLSSDGPRARPVRGGNPPSVLPDGHAIHWTGLGQPTPFRAGPTCTDFGSRRSQSWSARRCTATVTPMPRRRRVRPGATVPITSRTTLRGRPPGRQTL